MFLLDTNIISELMRVSPSVEVVDWLDSLDTQEVWTSSITVAEIYLGISLLPSGQRKTALATAAAEVFADDFSGRCLPFDAQAAQVYARIVSEQRKTGRTLSVEDAQIASIAITCNLTLATRNLKDFEKIVGLQLFNPWQATISVKR